MNNEHRSLLSRHRRALVRDIDNVEPLLDFLVSSGVFADDDEDLDGIRAQLTPPARARTLLDVLKRRGPDAYEHFLDALRTVRPHLAQLLEQSLGSKRPSPAAALADCIPSQASRRHLPAAVRKLQQALRDYYEELARSTTLLDYLSLEEPVGLDNVFVPLTALKSDEMRSLFAKQRNYTPQQIQELASKTWRDRRAGAEITDLSRLLRFADGKASKSCLLLGHAASGKTLSLLRLLSLWADGSEDFLKEYELVFYVRGQDKRTMEAISAVDVLQPDEYAGLDKAEAKQVATYLEDHSDKVLILFDSVDEGGEKWGDCRGIQQIIQRKSLGRCSFVVTGRPCLKAYKLIPRCAQHFHLAGLNDYNLEELLRRRLGEEEGLRLSQELQKPDWTKLRALMKETPLLANMVAVLVKGGHSLPKTRTEVYTTMLLNLVSRCYTKEDPDSPTCMRLNDLPEGVQESFSKIGKVALEGLRKGQFVFDANKDTLAKWGDAAQRLGLVQELRTMSVFGSSQEVHFCHLTWQEYLAAFCVSQANNVEKELFSCAKDIGLEEETLPFWRFVAGLLDTKNLKTLMTVLNGQATESQETSKWLLLAKTGCLAEAVQQHCASARADEVKVDMCEAQAAAFVGLPEKVDLRGYALSEGEVHSLSTALSCARHIIDVDLASCDLRLAHLKTLNITGGLRHLERLVCSWNNLHGDGLTELQKGLESNLQLKFLNLVACSLDESDCLVLVQLLSTNQTLETINLYKNPIGANGRKLLWPAVHDSQLKELNLSSTAHSKTDDAAHLSHGRILFGQHMETVHLTRNNLCNKDIEAVLCAAQNALSMSLLDLSNNRMDRHAVNVLATVFQQRAQLSCTAERSAYLSPAALCIRLHDNDLDKSMLEWLRAEMPATSNDSVECGMFLVSGGRLQKRDFACHFREYIQQRKTGDLRMQSIGLDAGGAEQVAKQLSSNVPVTALVLSFNSLGDEGASCLARALCKNSTLRALSLFENKIGNAGFAALCSTLVDSNSTLKFMSIGSNPIFAKDRNSCCTDACEQLVRLLGTCHGLEAISLSNTCLGDEECHAICKVLMENTTRVRLLSLASNSISDTGVAVLSSGLQENTTVRFLDLSKNPFGREGLSAICQSVEARNTHGHPVERVWIGDVSTDVSHLGGVVNRSTFSFSSLTSFLHNYCANAS